MGDCTGVRIYAPNSLVAELSTREGFRGRYVS